MKALPFILFLAFNYSIGFAQVFRIDSLPTQGVLLDKGWKFHAGDNPDWARPDFDDSKWEEIDPTKDIFELPQIQDGKIGWMRIRLKIDSSLLAQSYDVKVNQFIASEIYADGRLIEKFGKLDSVPIKAIFAFGSTINPPKNKAYTELAVRFAFQKSLPYNRYAGVPNFCFYARIVPARSIEKEILHTYVMIMVAFEKSGAFVILFLLHLTFFIFYPPQKANLYFSGMALCYAIHAFSWGIFLVLMPIENAELLMYMGKIRIFIHSIAYISLLIALYTIFDFKKDFSFWLTLGGSIIFIFVSFLSYEKGVLISEFGTTVLNTLASLYIVIKAILAKKHNAKLILIGLISSILFLIFRALVDYGGFLPELHFSNLTQFCDFIGVMSIPISISCFLGGDFAFVNRNLETKLKEVRQLSEENHQILASQNEILEKQVNDRTSELNRSLETLKSTQAQLIQKEKMASLGELTAGIAHEIQNPLNFVNNFSEVSTELVSELKDELERGDTHEAKAIADDLSQNLQKITHHGGRASSIVKGMLEHSRTSTGERQPTNLNALADEYLRLAYLGMRRSEGRTPGDPAKNKDFNAELVTDFAPDLSRIEVVPQEIGRVLLNLFNNAFYAVHQKQKTAPVDYQPTVSVSTQPIEHGVEIRVSDNGLGILDSIRDKIFQPFFTTKPTGEGTGLGLSLSYDIVTKGHGGTIEVESAEGEGTMFTITLPITIK